MGLGLGKTQTLGGILLPRLLNKLTLKRSPLSLRNTGQNGLRLLLIPHLLNRQRRLLVGVAQTLLQIQGACALHELALLLGPGVRSYRSILS
ncbi:hypothetical protein D3C71_1056840 [compost metagenome]